MQRPLAGVLAVVAALVGGGLVAGSPTAVANTMAFVDDSNDARRGIDIERVRVNNGRRIVVTTTFEDLRRRPAGLTVYFDTRGPDRGPEYLVGGGIGGDSDWQAVRIENWAGDDAHLLLRCDSDLRVRYGRDTATYDIARRCFKRPGRVRVGVMSSGNRASQRDWAPKPRRFYDWVLR